MLEEVGHKLALTAVNDRFPDEEATGWSLKASRKLEPRWRRFYVANTTVRFDWRRQKIEATRRHGNFQTGDWGGKEGIPEDWLQDRH